MSEAKYVCKTCGIECVHRADKPMLNAEEPCEVGSKHNWTDDDPLERLEARVMAHDSMFRVDLADNEEWQWIEVDVFEEDRSFGSEMLAEMAKQEGFVFCGLGDYDGSVRFNRQKD